MFVGEVCKSGTVGNDSRDAGASAPRPELGSPQAVGTLEGALLPSALDAALVRFHF